MTAVSPPPRAAALLALLALLATAACADPMTEEQQDGEAAESPLGSETPDPARDTLLDELATLRALLVAARDHLHEAATAENVDHARDAADETIELLIGDPTDRAPLFPVERGERGSGGDRADQLTTMLTVTREAGGTDGRAVRELLRDLVAGDLGAWQRDADGMVVMIEQTLETAGDLEATEEAVFTLPGEATRALAWAQLTGDASDADTARAYAERGATHLDIAVSAIDSLDLLDDGDEADDEEDGA